MEQSSSRNANSSSPTQEFPRILRIPKIHYHVYKILSHVPIPSHINPVHAVATDIFKININIIPPSTPTFLSGHFFRLPHQGLLRKSPFPHSCHKPCLSHLHLQYMSITDRDVGHGNIEMDAFGMRANRNKDSVSHFLLCHRWSVPLSVKYANK
jgi:hypothetical protein